MLTFARPARAPRAPSNAPVSAVGRPNMSAIPSSPTPTDVLQPPMPALRNDPGVQLRAGVIAFGVLLLVALWVTVLTLIQHSRTEAIEAEARQNTNLARVLREQTERVLATVDQATLRTRDMVAAAGMAAPDLVRLANETGLAPKILVQLALVGPDGRFVGSNIDPDGSKTGHVDLSTREHIRVHLAPDAVPEAARALPPNGLFVGKPVLGKVSGRWTIQLSRKILDGDGRMLGIIVASLDPGYFEEVYRQVALGSQGGVTLVGKDRTVRARVIGGRPAAMGASISANSPLAVPDVARDGSFISVSSLDGVERITAYRQVGDYPVFITVSTSVEQALEEWRTGRASLLTLSSALSLLIVAAAAGLVIGVRRIERVNAELVVSQREAQAASQAKSEFLAAISHELRTPLTSIRGFAELMEKRLDNPKFQQQAGMIRRGAEHLNNLLTEILDLSKVEAGVMPHSPTPHALRQLLRDTEEFFQPTAAQKNLLLQTQVADDVPEVIVCDGLRLKQILNNLLSNALKFTSSGRVAIEVERRDEEVLFHVVDTGPGIPPEMQEVVFERFRQGSERISHDHGGTGLGLTLSRGLANLMGGKLTLASEVGVGSRFTLHLPIDGSRVAGGDSTARPSTAAG